MRLQHVTITDMAGFAGVHEFDLPAICLITGKNGRGKSSLLDCLRYCFDSGHDEDMIHSGAECGEIIVLLDDGGAVRARAARADNKTTRDWRLPGARKWNINRSFIDKISAAISYNAASYLDLPERKQIEALLQMMPIQVDTSEVTEAIGSAAALVKLPALPPTVNGLELVDLCYDSIYDQRRELNVSADTQEKHASELERALPPPAPEGEVWAEQVDVLRIMIAQLEDKERAGLGELTVMFRGVKDDQTQKNADRETEINKEIDAEILALEKRRDERLNASRHERDSYIEEARQIGVSEAARIRGENAPVREQLTAELATAEERARQHERTEGTREAAIVARREATDKKANSEILTESLTRLKDLRLKVAERLPIKNIRIQDGRLYNLDKVAFKRWNTVQQLVFCLKIAVIAHREAGFVCIDNFEHFDTQMKEAALAACRKYAEDEGMQFILCAVSDEPELKVVEG
jgi:hypothetical protein